MSPSYPSFTCRRESPRRSSNSMSLQQRLGSIELKHDEDEGIALFDWCAESVEALLQSNAALAEAAAHAKELETTVKELKSQLDELVTSKQDDETALLQKFRDLLNEKKVKIREQQKVIAAGPFPNSQSASQRASQTLDPQPSHAPAPSRPRKRKVQAAASSSNEPGNDEMDVDKIKAEPEDSEPENTPEDTADDTTDDTASGDSDEDDNGNEDNGGENVSETGADDISKPAPKAPQKKANEQPPPPRSLPFSKKKAPAKPSTTGNETDSDDEL